MLGVSRTLVVRWIDTNKLPGYRVPFTKRRKVRSCDLQKFCKDNGLSELFDPLKSLAKNIKQRTVLLCGVDPTMARQLDGLMADLKVDTRVVVNPFDIMALAIHKKIIGVAVDMGIGREPAFEIGKRLKSLEKEMQTVGLVYGDEDSFPETKQAKQVYNCVIEYPFAVNELAEMLTLGRRSW